MNISFIIYSLNWWFSLTSHAYAYRFTQHFIHFFFFNFYNFLHFPRLKSWVCFSLFFLPFHGNDSKHPRCQAINIFFLNRIFVSSQTVRHFIPVWIFRLVLSWLRSVGSKKNIFFIITNNKEFISWKKNSIKIRWRIKNLQWNIKTK